MSGTGRLRPSRLLGGLRAAAADLHRLMLASEQQVRIAGRSEQRLTDLEKRSVAVAELLAHQEALLVKVHKELVAGMRDLATVRVATTAATMDEVDRFGAQHRLGPRETLTRLAADGLSLTRFGDGELRMIVDPLYHLGFQTNSPGLRAALTEALSAPADDALLVGWPRSFRTTHNSTVWSMVWDAVRPLVEGRGPFADSHVSRPITFLELETEAVELWRAVWARQKIAVVTGKGSRFDLVPALFDNVAGHSVVPSTPTNAFADLDRLEEEILHRSRADIHLVALGPAGTVLASRLARAGVRAIDVGHISNSYLSVVEGHPRPEKTAVTRRS